MQFRIGERKYDWKWEENQECGYMGRIWKKEGFGQQHEI